MGENSIVHEKLMCEINALRCECDNLKLRIDEQLKTNDHLQCKLETAEKDKEKLTKEIHNLRGQVDAYQYCMNCRGR